MSTLLAAALADAKPSPSGNWRAHCVFCQGRRGSPDRRRSLSILVSNAVYFCWRCGATGRLNKIPDALRARSGVKKSAVRLGPPEGFYTLYSEPGASALSLAPARAYMQKRGLFEGIWREAGIGACVKGFYQGRVIIPILGEGGVWLGWSGRAWVPKSESPYMYPAGMQRGEIVYNLLALTQNLETPLFIVEGCMDALALWPHAVALLGKLSENQFDLLVTCARPLVICLDPDAEKDAKYLRYRLKREGKTVGMVELPPGCDPDEVPKDWLWQEALRCL